ncbi:Sec-independent protein translocase subunit TatA/TatB [Haloplanus halophilus]|uniref:Sec-independent protein translocase subunit TatA/TatB n=1 Tax=Haloplanus halophilus TaxID=2949993 RepID=UPI00203BFF30|nr:twin-arginine translocase TatA/TatE family subunit [Haloplanus sp. GDY1]
MYDSIVPLFPGLPGGPELLIVLFVLVLLFGANKIPKLARSTGQAMGEFKRGREEIEEELQEGSESSGSESSGVSTGSESSGVSAEESTETSAETEKSN